VYHGATFVDALLIKVLIGAGVGAALIGAYVAHRWSLANRFAGAPLTKVRALVDGSRVTLRGTVIVDPDEAPAPISRRNIAAVIVRVVGERMRGDLLIHESARGRDFVVDDGTGRAVVVWKDRDVHIEVKPEDEREFTFGVGIPPPPHPEPAPLPSKRPHGLEEILAGLPGHVPAPHDTVPQGEASVR